MTLNGSSWYNANTITFASGATSARTMNGAQGIDMRDSGSKIENNSTATHVFNVPIAFNTGVEFNPVSGNLTFNSNVFFKANWLNVWGDNGNTLNLNGVLNRDGGDGGIAVKQNSRVVITNNNTITGAIWIEKGVVQLNGSTNAMGQSGIVNVGTNASLELNYSSDVILRPATLNLLGIGTNGLGAVKKVSTTGNILWPGPVTMTNATVIRVDGGELTFSNVVSAGGVMSKVGSGTLVLSGSNTYSGATFISNGVIRASHSNALGSGAASTTVISGGALETRVEVLEPVVLNGHGISGAGALFNDSTTVQGGVTNTVTISSAAAIGGAGRLRISGTISGGHQLTKVGSGTTVLTRANTSFSGAIIVSNGLLFANDASSLGGTASNTTVIAGAALEMGNYTTGENLVLNGHGIAGAGALVNNSPATIVTGTVNLASDTAIGGTGRIQLSGVVSGAGQLTKVGTGTNTLGAANTYTNLTIISNGVIRLTNTNALGAVSAGTIVRSGGAIEYIMGATVFAPEPLTITGFGPTNGGVLRSDGSGIATLAGTITLSGDSRIQASTRGFTYAANASTPLIVNLAGNTLYLGGDNNHLMNAGSVFTNATKTTGDGAIVKDGTGNFTLRPAVDMTGSIRVDGGMLILGANSSGSGLPAGGTLTMSGGTRLGGDANGRTVNKSMLINGNVALADNSTFNMVLNGAVSLGGATRIITNVNDVSINGVISNGGITKRGAGTMTNTAASTYSGATTIEAGTMALLGSATNSAFTVASAGTLRGTGTVGQLSVAGIISPAISTNANNTFRSMALTLEEGGKYVFDISNVAGTPGSNWDLISVSNGTGTITVNSSSGNPFEIVLVAASVVGWDNTTNYSWRIIDGGSVSGFASNKFTVNTVNFSPALGGGTFAVSESGGDLFLQFIAAGGPDIEARGNGLVIVSGDTTPSLADHTLFGDVLTDGGTFQRTYTFTNAGVAAVGLGNISFSGGNAGDFTVINQLPSTLPAGGTTNIVIEFDPGADGERWTDLTFTNTVAGKSPYTFRIAGTGVTYNLDVTGNGVIIADGDTTPSTADHTDFGTIGVSGDTLTRTFTITNSGNRDLAVSNVVITGTHAADFTVTTQPASSVAPGGTTTFQVQFDPSAVGLRTAEIVFTNSSTTGKNPYNFAIQGTGAGSGISNFPTTLSFSSVLGSMPSPAFQAFSVTNVGLGTLTYSLSTNASWLYYSNNANTAAAGAGNVHTAYVQYVGVMAAGTSNATITITGDSATTNSPKTISVSWTISAIPDPTAQTATADGAEFVRLAWTKNPSYDVMIIHRSSNAPAAPANGTAYSVGDSLGGGATVIYKGAGALLEHVVRPGSTNHYAFYSVNNNYYSPGVAAVATNPPYPAGVIIEQFAYTNGLSISGQNGGQFWTNAWELSSGTYTIFTNQFEQTAGYPTKAANTLIGTNAQAFRGITNVSSGKLYVAFKFRNTAGSSTEWSGLSFYNGGTELKFVGESFSADRGFTVGSTVLGTATLLPNTDYTIIVMHDFSANTTYGNIYTNATQTVPATEPGTWQVTDSGAMTAVNRIRLGGNIGMRWDEIRIATNYYELLEITPSAPALFVGPTNISLSVMKGSSTSATFVVTNLGASALLYTNTITYGAGSGWLTVAPTGGTVNGGSSRIHTGTVSAVSLAPGAYVATNRVSGNQTNPAVDVVFTMTVTNIPAPTAVTATNDGNELVRMGWTAAGALQVMIVHRANADISADPTDNTLYNVGDSIGGGTVIFKGTASSQEHVVAPGSTNYYRFYSVFNNHYSPNVAVAATTGVYRAGEIVDPFAYTNAVAVNGLNGGQGFTNAWATTAPNAPVDVVVDNVDFSTFQPLWPAERANRMVLKTTNSSTYTAQRHFTAVTSGKLYVAALYRREFNEGATDSKFSGISLMDGSNERMFVGEPGGASATYDDVFAVAMGATRITAGGANSFPAATDYLIIGRYDFDTGIFSGTYFTNSAAVPSAEPSFLVSVTGSFAKLDGVRFSSGADSGWNGQVFFDELRIATTWADLLLIDAAPPYATNYVIGNATNYVSDAQVNQGNFPVMMTFRAEGGVESTNTIPPFFRPNFDLLNPNGVEILTDHVFSVFTYHDAGLTLVASNTTHAGADISAVVLGVHTARWSAISSNGFSALNVPTLSNGTAIAFTVFDDDVDPPTIMNINSPESGASRSMHLTSNTTAVGATGGTSGTNITYRISDHYLATGLSGSTPLIFYFGARDAGSGLSRGVTDPDTQSSLSIGSAIISNVANWSSVLSSSYTNTYAASATNAWTFTAALSHAQIENLVTNATWGAAGSNRVTVTWRDADNDRLNDRQTLHNQQHGWLAVFDDDTTAPTIQNFVIRGQGGSYTVKVSELSLGIDWSITGRVSDASGINVNGTNTVQPNNSPYFELWDSAGTLRHRQAFGTLGFVDGGATTLSPVSNGAAVVSGVTFADVGVWTARVVVADNDEDFGVNDHAIGTNEFPFVVIVGDTTGGLGRGPGSFAVTSSYGFVTSTNPWPQFFVTNIGSGILQYDATISYSGAGGWLTVLPTNATIVGGGNSQIHTASVNASALSPGVYSATITLNGDQTNAAQTITVTLRVFGYYPGEIVDQFTNSTGSLEGMVGGSGWTNAWNNSPDSGFSINTSSLTVPTNYPAADGNKVCGDTAGTELQTFRYFNVFSTGKVFMAVAVRKTDGNSDGFNGISFMSNSTEVAFAGKVFNNGNFGIDLGANGGNAISSFGVNGTGDPGYFYVGMYDFSANRFYGRAFNNSDTLPLTEPSWQVTGTPTVAIGSIGGVRVAAQNEGTFCFDEVRVANSWESLLNQFTNEPNVHASAIVFSNVTTSSMNISWVPGNGANRIVVGREGAAVTFSPTDGVSYSFNSDFSLASDLGGGNKVIYNGGGSSFDLTGLNPTTQYFFAIFEYNGTANYFTNAGFATGSRWTLAIEPASNATALAAFTVNETSISNTWTAAAGSPAADGYLIFRSTNTVTLLPQDGVGYTNGQVINGSVALVVTPGSAVTALHTNLTACRTYHFRIFSFRWNGTSVETYNYNTNSTVTASAETECAEPTIQSSNIVFSAIGTNQITASWQIGNGDGRIVVVRGTNAVNAHPADGTAYTASANYGSGSHLGGGNYVVFNGTGATVTVTGLLPGVTYHFRVYEYNGVGSGIDYNTNTAVNNPRSTDTASFGIVEDKFIWNYFGDYANNNLSGAGTGTGWTNNWITFGGYVAVDDANMPPFKGYPADTRSGCGNNCDDSRQLRIQTVAGTAYGARRGFPPRNSGQLYAAVKFNVTSLPTNSFFGLSFMNGSSETGFAGKAWGIAGGLLSVEHNGVQRTTPYHSTNTYTISGGTGNDYLMVVMYDFDEKVLKARAYTTNNIPHAMPDRELGWVVEMTNVHISKIDGIRIAGQNVGDLYFDHIRAGGSWEDVIWNLPAGWHDDNGPVPTLVYIGTNYGPDVYSMVITNLSDAELKSSQLIDFAIRWDSPSGIFLTNAIATNRNIGSPNARVSPNWDPLAVGAATNPFNLDRVFTNFFGFNGATSVTTFQFAGFSITNIDFDVQYFVTVSAETHPGGATVSPQQTNYASFDAVPITRAITINEPLRFYVYDDDTNAPTLGSRPMRVLTNSVIASAQSVGSLERFFVYDGSLTQAGMRLSFNVYDEQSGLQQSTSGSAATNLSISVPYVATNNISNFDSTWSSTNTRISSATSVWSFAASHFSWDRVTAMWGGDGSGAQGQDLEVLADLPDADDDRVNDQSFSSNVVMGYLRLLDDDQDPPEAQNVVFSGAAARPFFVLTNQFAIGSGDTLIRGNYSRRFGTGSNTVFAVTDEELAQAGTRMLQFAFGARDVHSGIARGNSGSTNEVMSFSVGAGFMSGVVTGWSAALSSPASGANVLQTNIWSFTDGFFSETVITQIMAVTGPSGSGSNRIAVTIPDADGDRANDQSAAYSLTVGWLQAFDDDVKGPSMTGLQVENAFSDETVLFTSFEMTDGWPSFQASGTLWTNVLTNGLSTGVWYGTGYINLGDAAGGTRKAGFATTGVGQYFQTPPRSDVGRVTVDASLSSGTTPRHLELLYWSGTNWVSAGTNEVSSPEYVQLTWNVDVPGITTLRIVRVGTDGSPGIYMDNLLVTQSGFLTDTNAFGWTNLTSTTIRWNPATDDFSGIDEYRVVAPAIGTTLPTATNHGTGVSATSVVASLLHQQGLITGFVFAIDNDSDRSNDRSAGNVVSFRLRIDTNPPLPVLNATNDTTDITVDETTELKITWTPAAGGNMDQAAGLRVADGEPLSPWDTYIVTVHELDGSFNPISTTVITRANGPANLGSNTTSAIVLSNLNFDAYHRVRIAARDKAGNIGPEVVITGLTVNFQVTQGLSRVFSPGTNGVRLAWIASTNRVYDQLYVDAQSFTDALSNQWDWVDRITNNIEGGNMLVDEGGHNPTNRYRVPPEQLGSTMRFYRVSLQDAWQATNALRRGSREVYATKPIRLVPGENWYGTFFAPDTATVAYVFGTNRMPAGATYASATRIHWFSPTNIGSSYNFATNTVGLVGSGSSGQWMHWDGADWGAVANDWVFPTHQGFMIELPVGSPTIHLPIVGRVITQEQVIAIHGGSSGTQAFHILNWNYPVRVSLTGALFRGSGLVGHNFANNADEIRILNNSNGLGSLSQPKARWHLRSDQTTWTNASFNTNYYASRPTVANFRIEPDDVIVIIRRNLGMMYWTNRVYYSPPGKNFNP